jgi:FixJ family two-component response regulator
MIQRLGKVTDAEVAKELGIATQTVSLQRARLGIASFG